MHKIVHRYKITIEYCGTNYVGWQIQKNGKSIQGAILDAIVKLTRENDSDINLFGAGRTDAGVHATGQVAHFDLKTQWNPIDLMRGLNHFLKCDNFNEIQILNCEIVPTTFHARFSAIERAYIYRIINRFTPLCLDKERALHVKKPLNFELMNDAGQLLVGKHDFTSFRSVQCQANSPIRTISELSVKLNESQYLKTCKSLGDFSEKEIVIYCRAPSFLHNQVRIIVGTLIEVGLNKISVNDVKAMLDLRNRNSAGYTAPACGLYLCHVKY